MWEFRWSIFGFSGGIYLYVCSKLAPWATNCRKKSWHRCSQVECCSVAKLSHLAVVLVIVIVIIDARPPPPPILSTAVSPRSWCAPLFSRLCKAQFTQDAEHLATSARANYGTHCGQWECSQSLQATSKGLHTNLHANVLTRAVWTGPKGWTSTGRWSVVPPTNVQPSSKRIVPKTWHPDLYSRYATLRRFACCHHEWHNNGWEITCTWPCSGFIRPMASGVGVGCPEGCWSIFSFNFKFNLSFASKQILCQAIIV